MKTRHWNSINRHFVKEWFWSLKIWFFRRNWIWRKRGSLKGLSSHLSVLIIEWKKAFLSSDLLCLILASHHKTRKKLLERLELWRLIKISRERGKRFQLLGFRCALLKCGMWNKDELFRVRRLLGSSTSDEDYYGINSTEKSSLKSVTGLPTLTFINITIVI